MRKKVKILRQKNQNFKTRSKKTASISSQNDNEVKIMRKNVKIYSQNFHSLSRKFDFYL